MATYEYAVVPGVGDAEAFAAALTAKGEEGYAVVATIPLGPAGVVILQREKDPKTEATPTYFH